MGKRKIINILVILIVILSFIATITGIFSSGGPGEYEFKSILGEKVLIYGKGIYKNMSAEVAIQGIAQDVVTLSVGIPLLLFGLFLFNKNSIRGKLLLTGVIVYFLVTYLFYLTMAAFNFLFLIYAALLGLTFFTFINLILLFDIDNIESIYSYKMPRKFTGWFLIVNSILIALMWLQIVLPPILKGEIPLAVEHYTTLIVQGFDLGLLLPISFVIGFLLLKKNKFGYLFSSIYLVFLSILMSALSAKIIAMAMEGINVIPAVIIIPAINLITIGCTALIFNSVKPE